MFKNYLKMALRHLAKRKLYALIMVLGLSVSLAFTFLTLAYLWEEWQVNRSLRNLPAQYMVKSKWKQPNMGVEIATLAPLGRALKEEYPHLVANYYRYDGITSVVAKGDKIFRENIQVGDSTLLTMYGLPLLHGNPATALVQPNSIVITKAIALKYFGKTDLIGETLTISSFGGAKQDFVIQGVLADFPQNSVTNIWHNEADDQIFMSLQALSFFNRTPMDNWGSIYIPNYIELQKGVKKGDVENRMKALVDKYATTAYTF
jgi:putative ABC transport system permease protein